MWGCNGGEAMPDCLQHQSRQGTPCPTTTGQQPEAHHANTHTHIHHTCSCTYVHVVLSVSACMHVSCSVYLCTIMSIYVVVRCVCSLPPQQPCNSPPPSLTWPVRLISFWSPTTTCPLPLPTHQLLLYYPGFNWRGSGYPEDSLST